MTEDTKTLFLKAKKTYVEKFGCEPKSPIRVCAPGRVNLIGEHVDYNDGFVLPAALSLTTLVYGEESDDGVTRVVTTCDSCSYPQEFQFRKDDILEKEGRGSWINYVKGVIRNFHKPVQKTFNAVICSSVPVGGGLSSSAALEVAFYTFLEALEDSKANSLKEKALACQKAEHEFADVPCGIMDQFISVMGQKEHAVLIDCRSLEVKFAPFKDPNCVLLIINTNVKHELGGTEYAERRADCEKVAGILGIKSLRDATSEGLERNRPNMSSIEYKRAKHVIEEIQRTEKTYDSLISGDFKTVGKLFIASHESLKNLFEVSCPELDFVVNIVSEIKGVYGSRMTGGGFGGCTVTLVEKCNLDEVKRKVFIDYKNQFEKEASFFTCQPSDGARIL